MTREQRAERGGVREADMVDRVAEAIAGKCECREEDWLRNEQARAAMTAMRDPTNIMWDGLARSIMMWLDMQPRTPRMLFQHLKRTGVAVPQWLRDEPEMKRLDHVPSKGTRCVLIYRAMIDAALQDDVA